MRHIKNIIWDFNGTLLNDVDICLESINGVLAKRSLPKITKEYYRDNFSFPVIDFYKKIGFDFTKEEFEKPALEFIDNYNRMKHETDLFPEIIPLLDFIKTRNLNQTVLSAMEESSLVNMLTDLNIYDYFNSIAGIENHFAAGKIERGKRLITDSGIDVTETVMIGDTEHDAEVAKELGVGSILIAQGHYSKERLLTANSTVLDNLSELKRLLNSNSKS